jgi:hypothetical protein
MRNNPGRKKEERKKAINILRESRLHSYNHNKRLLKRIALMNKEKCIHK